MKRILVVDDEKDICKLIEMRLKKENYDVSFAHDTARVSNATMSRAIAI